MGPSGERRRRLSRSTTSGGLDGINIPDNDVDWFFARPVLEKIVSPVEINELSLEEIYDLHEALDVKANLKIQAHNRAKVRK